MTSMPASRSAAATTLAPRSWPSRPGLATRTRIGLIERTKLAAAKRERQSVLFLSGDEQHLGRRSRERFVRESIESLYDHQTGIGEQLRQASRRVETQSMLPCARPGAAFPGGCHGQNARQRIELALLREQRFAGRPPIAREKARHYTVAAAAMPDELAPRFQHSRKLAHDFDVIRWMREEPERSEQVHDRVESVRPARRHLSHVTAGIAKWPTGATPARDGDQVARVVEAVHAQSGLGE